MAVAVTSAPWQQVNMPALDLRRYLMTLVADEGVRLKDDLKVSQRAAGANMSVDVAAGLGLALGDDVAYQGPYLVPNDAVLNLAIAAADPTNPRVDRVIAEVRDSFHGGAANDCRIRVVTGTPTSGATLVNCTGAGAVPNNAILLGNVLVAAGAASITDAAIDTTGGQNNSPRVRPPIVAGSTGYGHSSGDVKWSARRLAEEGWLKCDGAAVSRSTYASLFEAIAPSLGTITVTIASPGVFTLASHGLVVGDKIYLTTTGALPTGLSANTIYYVVSTPTSSTFTVSATEGGSAINTSGSQSGVHTARFCPWGLGDGGTTFNVPDLSGRAAYGAAGASGHARMRALGMTDGFTLANRVAEVAIVNTTTDAGGATGGAAAQTIEIPHAVLNAFVKT